MVAQEGPQGRRIPAGTLLGMVMVVALFGVQVLLGKVGHRAAGLIPYQSLDPYDAFAGLAIHHLVQMALALVAIALLGKLLGIEFCLGRGDVARGTRYVVTFTAVFALIAGLLHALLLVQNRLPAYAFPLDSRNVLGTLGFQLLLSGPSEEIVFRALPVPLLVYALGRSLPVRGPVTLEVLLASILFALAHTRWSLSPLEVEADAFALLYAFVLGTIQGVVYQRSRSILYPMLMHSLSNVLMVGMGYLATALAGLTARRAGRWGRPAGMGPPGDGTARRQRTAQR